VNWKALKVEVTCRILNRRREGTWRNFESTNASAGDTSATEVSARNGALSAQRDDRDDRDNQLRLCPPALMSYMPGVELVQEIHGDANSDWSSST
jgi:hypothetical protein